MSRPQASPKVYMHQVLNKLLLQLLTPGKKRKGMLVKLKLHRKTGKILGTGIRERD